MRQSAKPQRGVGTRRLELGQLVEICRNQRYTGVLIAVVFAAVMALFETPFAAWQIGLWYTGVVAGWAVFGLLQWRFLLAERQGRADPRIWQRRFCACQTFTSIFFAAIIPAYGLGDLEQHVTVLLIPLAALTFAAIAVNAHLPIFYAILGPNAFAVLFTGAFHERGLGPGFLIVSTIYFVFLAITAHRASRSTREAIELRLSNQRLIDDLDSARRKAENASEAKSDFIAHLSHEIRTPVNAILGFSEMIRDETVGPIGNRKYSEYAGDIHASGAYVLELVNDVLDVAKIDAGQFNIDETDVDFSALTAECIALVRGRADARRQKIEHCANIDLTVRADRRALKQILLNLLSNAIKFTPEEGVINVGVALAADGAVGLSVSDTGIGIAPADIARVTDSFAQGPAKPSLSERGTGLGLTIARGLTELHGGRLEIESTLGRGTTVTVWLPAPRLVSSAASAA